jgi:hypothetical protein
MTPNGGEVLPAGVLRKALEFSYNGKGTHGAFLGLFEEALVLSIPLSMNELDADSLCARVLAFTETAQGIALELERMLSEEGGYVIQKQDDGMGVKLTEPEILFKV